MKKPTPQQLKAEIEWLKQNRAKMPRYNFFREDLHEKLDAQIEVLEQGLDEDAIYVRCHFEDDSDERAADDSLWHYSTLSPCLEAMRWRDGDQNDPPSAAWKDTLQHVKAGKFKSV